MTDAGSQTTKNMLTVALVRLGAVSASSLRKTGSFLVQALRRVQPEHLGFSIGLLLYQVRANELLPAWAKPCEGCTPSRAREGHRNGPEFCHALKSRAFRKSRALLSPKMVSSSRELL